MNGRLFDEPFSIIEVEPEWVLEQEALGSKEKFWFRRSEDEREWLFKYPRPNTGEHWAEKIAAEVANSLRIPHAHVKLAIFQGHPGCASESFMRKGAELVHGNQILAGEILGYQPNGKSRNADHTLENIWSALEATINDSALERRAKLEFAEYLVLDALVGNTDRHHENWGLLRRRVQDGWYNVLAPSFDHASSLGRELSDSGPRKTKESYLAENTVASYSEKARGGIYWSSQDRWGVSPIELVRKACVAHPEQFRPALTKLQNLDPKQLEILIAMMPDTWMTLQCNDFALALMRYNLQELHRLVE